MVDYAICVTIDGSPSGAATIVDTRFFTCNQNTSDADNCKGNTFVDIDGTCTVTGLGVDPFAGNPAADDSPFDTAVECQDEPGRPAGPGREAPERVLVRVRLDGGEPGGLHRELDPGSITIVKDAVPNDAQDFTFDPSDNLSVTNFTLDDDGETVTLSNQRSFSDLAASAAGTLYTISEVSVPGGWALTNIVCTGGTGITDRIVDGCLQRRRFDREHPAQAARERHLHVHEQRRT